MKTLVVDLRDARREELQRTGNAVFPVAAAERVIESAIDLRYILSDSLADDAERPQPPVVPPGETVSIPAPSDSIILFDGKDLSQWVNRGANGAESPATWTVREGYFETQGGNLSTRESFGDVQLHLEYAIPADVTGSRSGFGA